MWTPSAGSCQLLDCSHLPSHTLYFNYLYCKCDRCVSKCGGKSVKVIFLIAVSFQTNVTTLKGVDIDIICYMEHPALNLS
jgi:hypothetical protein